MECFEKRRWNKYTRKELYSIRIEKPSEEWYEKVQKKWDSIAKPLDSMGDFERLFAKIGAITGTTKLDITKKAVIIMCADNGIVEEGVSQSGKEVTAAVARNMVRRQSSVGKMAAVLGADTIPVDIGINQKEPIIGMVQRKIRYGTANFRKEPAMTEEETIQAIFTGIEMIADCKEKGYQLLATGEMGIGNTTTSSAIATAMLDCEVAELTGRGAGLSDSGLSKKRQVIEEALEKYQLRGADALRILSTVGGLDIAGLVGVCIGGAMHHVPIVLDGVISLVAALVAEKLLPGVKDYLLPSHMGKEPAIKRLMEALDLKPVIYAGLALGEGTGAVMMFSLLDMANAVYQESSTFEEIEVEQYKRVE